MEDVFVKECHATKIRLICSCCGSPFEINPSDKREKWCSGECRLKLIKGKPKPKPKEKSLRDMVDEYYDGGDADYIDDMEV